MGRSPCCDGSALKKGPWSPDEDQKLSTHIQNHGQGNWRSLPKHAGINRCGKSCRLRWINYLRPDIKRGKFTQEEEEIILNLHFILGNKWAAIARQLPGRTDNEIKNFWNTHLKKKLIEMGFDPMTHRPQTNISSGLAHIIGLATLKQLMNNPLWEEHPQILQYRQYLDQYHLLQAPSLTNIINSIHPTEIEIMNLINSLSSPLFQNQMIMTQNYNHDNNNNNPLQSLGTDSVCLSLSHLPSLEIIPNNTKIYETTPFNVKEMCVVQNNEVCDTNNCPWQLPSSTAPSPPNRNSNHDGPSSNTNNCGDACSSSSFVGSSASIWPDHLLLEHSFLHNTPRPPPWL